MSLGQNEGHKSKRRLCASCLREICLRTYFALRLFLMNFFLMGSNGLQLHEADILCSYSCISYTLTVTA